MTKEIPSAAQHSLEETPLLTDGGDRRPPDDHTTKGSAKNLLQGILFSLVTKQSRTTQRHLVQVKNW